MPARRPAPAIAVGMRIAVLANLKVNAPTADRPAADAWAELDSPRTVETLVGAFRRAGHTAEFFEGDLSLVQHLPAFAPDLCMNLCEGHFGDARESHVPALLEMLRLPYTGAGVKALALTLDKAMTKRLLRDHGIPTAPFQSFSSADDALDPALRFPLVVKPVGEGSGMGVTDRSLVRDEAALRDEVARLVGSYHQPALVEAYLPGRELTVGMVGNVGAARVTEGPWAAVPYVDGLHVLPALEVLLHGGLYTDAMKNHWEGSWDQGVHYACPAPVPDALRERIVAMAVATFRATGCRDVARVDVRLDAAGEPMVLEINALPGMSPGWSDITLEAAEAGVDYDQLALGIVAAAWRRLGR
jgi:D-alanine-D-alanine ligase